MVLTGGLHLFFHGLSIHKGQDVCMSGVASHLLCLGLGEPLSGTGEQSFSAVPLGWAELLPSRQDVSKFSQSSCRSALKQNLSKSFVLSLLFLSGTMWNLYSFQRHCFPFFLCLTLRNLLSVPLLVKTEGKG